MERERVVDAALSTTPDRFRSGAQGRESNVERPNGSSSRRETPAQLQRSTTAVARRRANCGAVGRSKLEELPEPAGEIVRVARVERRQVAERGRIGRLQPGRDLGEPRVARDERRAAGRGGLGRDHPEGLREDRRHDAGVREGEQMAEVAVLERAGEECLDATVGGSQLERGPLGAEADDDEARARPRRARR